MTDTPLPPAVRRLFAEGQALAAKGQVDAALAAYRRAAETSKGDFRVWGAYIAALRDAGRRGRARKAARTAPVDPATRRRLVDLADRKFQPAQQAVDPGQVSQLAALITSGRLVEAVRLADQLIDAAPGAALLHNLRGVIALEMRDLETAERQFREALKCDPEMADATANLGLTLIRRGLPMAAMDVLESYASKQGAKLALRVNLASAYDRAGMTDKTLALTEEILAEAPDDRETIALRAEALTDAQRADEALTLLERAQNALGDAFDLQDLVASAIDQARGREALKAYVTGLPPRPPATAGRLAEVLAQCGETDLAAQEARSIAASRPDEAEPYRQIGLFGRWQDDDPLIAVMKDRFEDTAAPDSVRGQFGMALSKALFDTSRDSEGFEILIRANAFLRNGVRYDSEAGRVRFHKTTQLWDERTITRLIKAGDRSVSPIFIIGLPRSGSTLIEAILSRHPDVAALGESPVCAELADPLWDQPTAKAVRSLAWRVAPFHADKAQGKPRVTDKLLNNFLHAGLLAATFPNARFIEASRDLRAICLSIFQTPLSPAGHPYSMDLHELGTFARRYDGLMDHWQTVLGPRLYRCRYEKLVADPEPEIRRLLDELDLSWSPDCLRPEDQDRRVDTFSVAQVRQPLHTGSTDRWRSFETELAPLLEVLDGAAERPPHRS